MIGATASTMATTQSVTSIPRIHTALAAEKPTPVTTVNQAARHNGHFGSNTSTAPGTIEAAALESRRPGPSRVRPRMQQHAVIAHLPVLRAAPSRAAVFILIEYAQPTVTWKSSLTPLARDR